MRILVLSLLLACGPQQLSTVSLENRGATAEEMESARLGASLWEQCGVRLVPDGDRVIGVASTMDLTGPAGWVDMTAETIWLNRAYSDYPSYQVGVAAHEMGHLLSGKPDHLPRRIGIMSSPHHGAEVTSEDLDLVCP